MTIPLPPRTLVRGGEGLGVGGSLAGDRHRNYPDLDGAPIAPAPRQNADKKICRARLLERSNDIEGVAYYAHASDDEPASRAPHP